MFTYYILHITYIYIYIGRSQAGAMDTLLILMHVARKIFMRRLTPGMTWGSVASPSQIWHATAAILVEILVICCLIV